MGKPALIVSDIHLGSVPDRVERQFVDFLAAWRGRAELLLINGDLFDFWFEYRTVVQSRHFHVLRALADLRDSDVRIALVGGNHDAWAGPFLEEEIGIELAEGPIETSLAGRRALVAHGDGLGPGDLGYKILRATLRSRPVRRMMRWVHPDLAARIVHGISRTGGRSEADVQRSLERARVLEEYALNLLQERSDLELVVFGHCHRPLLRRTDDGRYYVNSGDWVEHTTYTVVGPNEIRQSDWVTEEPQA